jgi:AcrR family transcriptional regulator
VPAKSPRSRRAAPQKRSYDSPLRRQQYAETRERIIAAGARIVHGLPTWDWDALTFAAVGDGAGVSARTVHRHFSTERKLRDAVLQRLMQESGVSLEQLELDTFARLAGQVLAYLSSFAVTPQPVLDPTFAAIDAQRRTALLGAVARAAPQWPAPDQQAAAAMLDVFWNPAPFERLLGAWGFDSARAIGATTWLIGLIEDAIRSDRRPGTRRPRR